MMNLKPISIRATVCLYMPASACVEHTQHESACGGHKWITERLLASVLHLSGCIVPCSRSFVSQTGWLGRAQTLLLPLRSTEVAGMCPGAQLLSLFWDLNSGCCAVVQSPEHRRFDTQGTLASYHSRLQSPLVRVQERVSVLISRLSECRRTGRKSSLKEILNLILITAKSQLCGRII